MKATDELFIAAVSTVLLAGCATSHHTSDLHAALFDVIDRDHDGRIDRAEFIDWNTERLFKIYDRNHDGGAYVEKRQALIP
jgi:Ca2+-binding EF-hand superfamily protein